MMDKKLFSLTINQISEEKGIPREEIIKTIEAALASAYRKDYGKKSQVIRVKFDEETGDFVAFQIKKVVEDEKAKIVETPKTEELQPETKPEVAKTETGEEGKTEEEKFHFNPEKHISLTEAQQAKPDIKVDEELEIELPRHSDFGRIAAQTAKQVVIQRIREAERSAIYGEFKKREGEVVTATVQRIKPSTSGRGENVVFDIGRTVGILFPQDQVPSDKYRIGARFKVYISKVEEDVKGPRIIISRTSPELVKKLFALEIPEITSGVVEIKALVREAGSRTKIAVASTDESVDPIGACVGQKGIRVQTIMGELGGEKIDIIKWSPDPSIFTRNALSPAKVADVDIIEKEKRAIAKVAEDQFSLAVGKQGQNVRLAAKLVNYKIDVVTKKEGDEKVVVTESAEPGTEALVKPEQEVAEEVAKPEEGVEETTVSENKETEVKETEEKPKKSKTKKTKTKEKKSDEEGEAKAKIKKKKAKK